MKTRLIHSKIFSDSFFASLNPNEKLLFTYYLTNEHINILHVYECSDRVASFETGLSTEDIQIAKQHFEEQEKLFFKGDFVFIRNAHKYQVYAGPKNESAKIRMYNSFPSDVQDWLFDICKRYDLKIYDLLFQKDCSDTGMNTN